MKNKKRIFAAVVMMVVLMCCPLVTFAANTTGNAVETEEELSFEERVDNAIDAFERKYDNAFEVEYHVFESSEDLEEYWNRSMKANQILIGLVRNSDSVKVAFGSKVNVTDKNLEDKLDALVYSDESWGDWAFEVLCVFLRTSYELQDASALETGQKENFIDTVQSGLFKFGNTIMWFIIVLLVLICLWIFMKIIKITQDWLLVRSQRKTVKKKALRKAEEERDLTKVVFEKAEYNLKILRIEAEMLEITKKIEAEKAESKKATGEESKETSTETPSLDEDENA